MADGPSNDKEPTAEANVSSGYEWADFALVVDTGEESKCHKVMLAQSSPFFEAMLSSDCEETKNGKMKAKDFRLETVATFLEYIYATAFSKKFDESKITPELMRLCHLYQVHDLYELVVGYLKENICDTNAVDIWLEADKIKNEDMMNTAIEYIADKKKNIGSVVGMEEAYWTCPLLVKSLVSALVGLKVENNESIAVKDTNADEKSSASSGCSAYEAWGSKWSDFALVLDTGEELKCHKVLLAQCSPFLKTMLLSDCEETKMQAKDLSLETVTTFLEYLYADAFQEDFEQSMITPELMRMCHEYQILGLYDLATCHLKENICDTNAVGIWFEAEKIKNEDMKNSAIEYIANKKEDVAKVAGIDEAYKCPVLMKSLVTSLASLFVIGKSITVMSQLPT